MSHQKTSKDSPSAISSVASEDGQELCRSQDGAQTDLFGQEVPLVSLSQAQEIKKAKTTLDTSGLSSSISSESANLQQSLENKLRQQLDLDGSMIYKLTWKQKVTPQRRSYCHLAASALRTKETGSSSWLTPTTSDMNGVRELDGKRSGGLNTQVQSSWPTPTAATGGASKNPNNKRGINGGNPMATAAAMVPWPTPSVRDYKDTGNLDKSRFRKSGKERNDTVPRVAYGIDPWATPTANPANGKWEQFLERKRKSVAKGNKMGISLTDTQMQAKSIAPWATPNTLDHMALRSDEALLKQSTTVRKGRTFPNNLREQVDPRSQEIYASGKIPPPSTAETENTVPSQLNPRFSLWLMGYPIEWAYCAERVTQSSRKRQRKS